MRLIIFLSLVSSLAYANTDYTCMNVCESKGYAHELCKERCSYGEQHEIRNYRNSVDQQNAQRYNRNYQPPRGKYQGN